MQIEMSDEHAADGYPMIAAAENVHRPLQRAHGNGSGSRCQTDQ